MSNGDEKRAAFNEQMNEWVSRQGVWFQLRHAADGQTLISRLLRLSLRVVIFLIIIAVGVWFYLIKRVDSSSFRENVRQSIETNLKGEGCEVGTFKKERDVANLSYLKIKGTKDSFYHHLEARGIRMNMGIADGLVGSWNAENLVMDQLEANIKAGDSDDGTAAGAFKSLFIPEDGFEFERIECKDATLTWGYSEHNQGAISGAYLTGFRENDGWRIELAGGTFRQNWLKNLKINKMIILCYPQGITIEQADLEASDGSGSVTFRASVGSGGQPSVQGTLQMTSMPMQSLLPPSFAEWIQGSISGEGLISGSTNSQEGIVLDLDLEFQDGDITSVRDSIPVLSALTVIDLYNSYRKVSFSDGTCHIRTGGNLLKISALDLKAGDLLHLKGNVDVRLPSHEEIANALNITDAKEVTGVLERNWELENSDTESSLAKSGVGTGSEQSQVSAEDAVENVFRASILAELTVKRFDGKLELGLKPDAFDKAAKLKAAYPVDSATNRIWLEVPLEGRLQTLTLKQAEQLYVLGRKTASD